MDIHRLFDYATAFKQAAYGLLSLSVSTGALTYKFTPYLSFMNENAPALGVGMTFVFGMSGIGFAVANYRINAKRRRNDDR